MASAIAAAAQEELMEEVAEQIRVEEAQARVKEEQEEEEEGGPMKRKAQLPVWRLALRVAVSNLCYPQFLRSPSSPL